MRFYFYRYGFWARLTKGSAGISVAWNRPLLFSERHGYSKIWRLGKISFEWLEAP